MDTWQPDVEAIVELEDKIAEIVSRVCEEYGISERFFHELVDEFRERSA